MVEHTGKDQYMLMNTAVSYSFFFVYIVTYFKLWHAELFIQYICMQIHTRLSHIV